MAYEVFLIIWLGFNLIFASLSAYMANRWGRDPFAWLLIGTVLGPIGLLLLVLEHRRDIVRARLSLGSAGSRVRGQRQPTVLVAVDGSAMSDQAVRHVVEQLDSSLDEVTVISVLPIERSDAIPPEDDSPRSRLLKEEIARHIGSACSTLQDAGIACRSVIRFGDPATEVLKLAEEIGCDLIVVGRRGRGRAAKLLLGSVSEKVTREAACPVTVVG